jgi:hypothetical protein
MVPPLALVPALALALAVVWPAAAWSQNPELRSYLRSVSSWHGVDPTEVEYLLEGALSPEEIPVALWVSRRSGVSAEAVLALRRAGTPWADLLARYGLQPGQLHVGLPSAPGGEGGLAAAYTLYGARPRNAWRAIELPDEAVVQLVNLRFLAASLELPPARVAEALVRSGSAVQAHRMLLRPGLS